MGIAPWTQAQIDGHIRAAGKLDRIMADSLEYLRKNKTDVDEYQVQQFILSQFRENNLISDVEPPIVAFGKNTQHVHYFPSKNNCSKLKKGDLIMIDIWAKENETGMPFADITWMGCYGQKPAEEVLKIFNLVIGARDGAIKFIQKRIANGILPVLSEIDQEVVEVFKQEKLEANFHHTTGHVLGFDQAHGDKAGVIGSKNSNKIIRNIGYTIEPGLYFDKKFGVRSEIDFYVSDDYQLQITSNPQKKLALI